MNKDFSDGQDDKEQVEITLKGSARAVGNILTGKLTSTIEDKLYAEKDLEQARADGSALQSKLWKVEDELRDAKSFERRALSEQERLMQLVRERGETIIAHQKTINDLHAKVAELEGKVGVELTDEQHAKLAEERERVFQSVAAHIQFPSLTPPKSFTGLFSFFFFPIFQNAAESREGEWGALTDSQKIRLIKAVRNCTGVGLKEAKEFVEGKERLRSPAPIA